MKSSLLSTNVLQTNLVSDLPGVAQIQDPTLINPSGISSAPGSGAFGYRLLRPVERLYLGDVNGSPIQQAFKVVIAGESPTGQVFNINQPIMGTGNSTDFTITDGVNSGPAVFLFATKSGVISGWDLNVGPQMPFGNGTVPAESQSAFEATDGAVYMGLAIGNVGSAHFLYAADFHNGKIDVIDGQFHKTVLSGGFIDPNLPVGFAPFNVQTIGGKVFVAYAKQDAAKDGGDVAGHGNGFIDVFETNGQFTGRLVSSGDLNSPWGIVQAPAGFGDVGGAILVGNFGDGRIHAFDPATGQELGTLLTAQGLPQVIPGLRALTFGNGQTAGDASKLYFTAGLDGELHGLFGSLTATTANANQPLLFAVGAGAGGGPEVKVFDATTKQLRFDFFAYDPGFTGGVRVAVGDVNGDGASDIITAPGPGGGPDIHVYDGKTGQLALQFFAFNPAFSGGAFVAAGDVNGDGRADIIAGAGQGGGPNVTVFSGNDGTMLDTFFAFDPAFSGGVTFGSRQPAAGEIIAPSRRRRTEFSRSRGEHLFAQQLFR